MELSVVFIFEGNQLVGHRIETPTGCTLAHLHTATLALPQLFTSYLESTTISPPPQFEKEEEE